MLPEKQMSKKGTNAANLELLRQGIRLSVQWGHHPNDNVITLLPRTTICPSVVAPRHHQDFVRQARAVLLTGRLPKWKGLVSSGRLP